MAEDLDNKFSEKLEKSPFSNELAGQQRLALALSGGPDSMALCRLLSRWAKKQSAKIIIHALTVDHGLRPEAAEEAQQVAFSVKDWPCIQHKILKASEPLSSDGRVMEGARNMRYSLMTNYCSYANINKLFLAHHQDDQAETFLFRLAKGSGLDGLGAMRNVQPCDKQLSLLRPLLNIPKKDLVTYCLNLDIPFIEDPTNTSDRFARNRLRKSRDVLAKEGLTAKRLSTTAMRMARARDALDFYAYQALHHVQVGRDYNRIELDGRKLADEPGETRLRVLVLAMDEIRPREGDGDHGPRRQKLEILAEKLFDKDKPFKRRTLGGFIFTRDIQENLITIENETKNPANH